MSFLSLWFNTHIETLGGNSFVLVYTRASLIFRFIIDMLILLAFSFHALNIGRKSGKLKVEAEQR